MPAGSSPGLGGARDEAGRAGGEEALLGLGQSTWYNYRCRSCGFETKVEDIIVDSFPPFSCTGIPELLCPQCNGTLQYVEDSSAPAGR